MKLFLHWLLWDMRRFRVMLLIWTLLVLGYACFLGWIHAGILTVDPDWLEWSGPVAKLLFGVEVLMLLHLFSTDPAVGTDPFWKTRPAAGWAVAGSKLAVAAVFYLLLPMAAWFAMSAWCVLSGTATLQWEEISWTRFLWMMQTLVVGIMALGAAVIRNAWQIPTRLAAGLLVAAAPTLAFVMIQPFGLTVVARVIAQTGAGLMTPSASWLFLLTGCGIYLAVRMSRTPDRAWPWAVALLPAVLLWSAPLLPVYETAKDQIVEKPSENPSAMKDFKVEGMPLRDGIPYHVLPLSFAKEESYLQALYGVKLRVSGLPEGLPADGAGWRDLKLTAPDGRMISADAAALQAYPIKRTGGGDPRELSISNACFNKEAIASFSLLPCRAEGTVRILLQGRESAEMPLRPGTLLETPPGYYYLAQSDFRDLRWAGTLTMTPREGFEALKRMELENLVRREVHEVQSNERFDRPGLLVQSRQSVLTFNVGGRTENLRTARFDRELREGMTDDTWRLRFSWAVPRGYVDVPVVLESFVIPRPFDDPRKLEDVIAAVPIQPGWPADRVKSALVHVLTLANQRIRNQDSFRKIGNAVEAWLSQIPQEHWPVLLELARANPPAPELEAWGSPHPPAWERLLMDDPLARRIAAMLPASAVEALRLEPELFQYLSPALISAGVITEASTNPPEPVGMSDEALAAAWKSAGEEGTWHWRDPWPLAVLAEASARGLPWSLPAVRELWNLRFYAAEKEKIHAFMVLISDCPAASWEGRRWLDKHLADLQWDAARKRWVLPDAAR